MNGFNWSILVCGLLGSSAFASRPADLYFPVRVADVLLFSSYSNAAMGQKEGSTICRQVNFEKFFAKDVSNLKNPKLNGCPQPTTCVPQVKLSDVRVLDFVRKNCRMPSQMTAYGADWAVSVKVQSYEGFLSQSTGGTYIQITGKTPQNNRSPIFYSSRPASAKFAAILATGMRIPSDQMPPQLVQSVKDLRNKDSNLFVLNAFKIDEIDFLVHLSSFRPGLLADTQKERINSLERFNKGKWKKVMSGDDFNPYRTEFEIESLLDFDGSGRRFILTSNPDHFVLAALDDMGVSPIRIAKPSQW